MAYIGLTLPKNAKFNFDAFYISKGYFPFFLIAGSLLIMFSAIRLQRLAVIGGSGILLSLALVFILEKIAGSTVGSPAWVVMLFSMPILFPICGILCGISGIASLIQIIQEYPSEKYPLIALILFIFMGISLFLYIAARPPNLHQMLDTLFTDKNQAKRLEILHLLQDVNDSRIIDPLILILRNPNEPDYIRSAAVWALGSDNLDPRSVKPLAEIVRDEKGCCRTDAVFVLGRLASTIDTKPDSLSFQTLTDALKDQDESVRAAAVQAISGITSHEVLNLLTHALKDESEVVRFHAREGLMRVRKPSRFSKP